MATIIRDANGYPTDDAQSGDLGWCEVCEQEPATQQARYLPGIRICAECAEGEPEPVS